MEPVFIRLPFLILLFHQKRHNMKKYYIKTPIVSKRKSTFLIVLQLFVAVMLLSAATGCEKDEEAGFSPDFTYDFQNENNVSFKNQSTGEYYSLMWDFGNGTTDTTTDKNKTYTVYYPEAGDYTVTLRLLNYTGGTKSVSKTLNIARSDFELDFTATVSPDNPYVVTLENTTTGLYDSYKWIYRNREVENQSPYQAYFPFAGNHDIELQVFKGQDVYTITKSINIAQDDPNYLDHFQMVWSDEFDGTSVDAGNWTFETGASGWGNNELQNYTDGENASVSGGELTITAKKVDDLVQVGSYTSARLSSRSKQEFKYGRMEINAKLPSGVGIWPAIWMLGSNFTSVGWPACGEMDIMEYVGFDPNRIYSTVHTSAGYGSGGTGSSMEVPTCEEEFHIYGLLWTENELVFYVDSPGNVVYTYSPASKTPENWPFNQAAFFILNVAVGGNWGGAQGIDNSIFPQSMYIDYVRVYQESLE